MKKRFNPFLTWGSYVGAVIGLILGMLPLIIGIIQKETEIGFALQPLLILSVPLIIVGFIFGFLIHTKRWYQVIGGLIGLLIGIIFFLLKYIPYSNLPSIEQRGFGQEIFTIIFITSGLIVLGNFIGWVVRFIIKKY